MRLRSLLFTVIAYSAIAFSLTGPALFGNGSLMPEGFIDADLLYGHPGEAAAMRPFEDSWPVAGDLGREQAFAEGTASGSCRHMEPVERRRDSTVGRAGGAILSDQTHSLPLPQPRHAHGVASCASNLGRAGDVPAGPCTWALRPRRAFYRSVGRVLGSLAADLPYTNHSAVYVLPWALLGAHKLATRPGAPAVALSGAALGIAALAGHPSMVLLVYVAYIAWFVGEAAHTRPPLKELARSCALALAAGLVSMLIGALGVLPLLELMAHGYSYKHADIGEAIWHERLGWTRDVFALALFFPSALSVARDTIPTHLWPWAEGASVGLGALFLAAVGWRSARTYWGLLLVLVLGIALTIAPLGLRWVHDLPGIRIILPWYCYSLIAVPLCLLAGFGLQNLSAGNPRKLLRLGLALGVLWLACFAFLLFGGLPYATWRPFIIGRSLLSMTLGLDLPVDPLRFDVAQLQDWRMFVSPVFAISVVTVSILLIRTNATRAVIVVALIILAEAAIVRIPTIVFERSVGTCVKGQERLQPASRRCWPIVLGALSACLRLMSRCLIAELSSDFVTFVRSQLSPYADTRRFWSLCAGRQRILGSMDPRSMRPGFIYRC